MHSVVLELLTAAVTLLSHWNCDVAPVTRTEAREGQSCVERTTQPSPWRYY